MYFSSPSCYSLTISSPLDVKHEMLQIEKQKKNTKFRIVNVDIVAADWTKKGVILKVVLVLIRQ